MHIWARWGNWSGDLESSKIIRTLSTVDAPQFSSDITAKAPVFLVDFYDRTVTLQAML